MVGEDAEDDAVAVDAVAAAALVAAAEDLGHRRAARRLRRRLFGDAADEDVTTPLVPREHALVLGCPRSAADGECLTLPDIAVQDVTDAQGAAAMAAALECEPVVAVDAEWPPGTAAATLLQVATPQTVYLVDLAALTATRRPSSTPPSPVRVPCGYASDATRLRRAAPAAPDPATGASATSSAAAGLAAGVRRARYAPRQGGAALGLGPAAAVARAAAYAALARVLLQIAATYPFPAALGPDDVAALAVTGRVLSDGDIDFLVVVRCKALALLRRGERRRLAGGRTPSLARTKRWRRGQLVGLFGLPRGALGPIGAHRAARSASRDPRAGRWRSGAARSAKRRRTRRLVACLGGRAVLF